MHCLAAIKLQNLTAINLHFLIAVDSQTEKTVSTEEYENQLVLLKSTLSKVQRTKENLLSENRRLTLENKELLNKYQRLLGRYQTEVGTKIIHS